jgi:rod shape determining protein RodA
MTMSVTGAPPQLGLGRKLLKLNWMLPVFLALVSGVGFAMLYSVAGADFDPWARAQMIRFTVGFLAMFIVAMIDIRLWYKAAWPFYIFALVLLIAVEFVGTTGMGAQRWINLGFIKLQPSELMKIALVVVLARYYHDIRPDRVKSILLLVPPLLLIAMPAALVIKQPDLGTAVLLCAGGIAIMFMAGASLWFFSLLVAGAGGLVYAVFGSCGQDWQILKDYQCRRITTFIDPASDPQGAGYHITQSKIAFGSGGYSGMGFTEGPQSRLDFLPEKHTDFIFTTLGEEFGLIGALALLGLYMLILLVGMMATLRIKHTFGRLVATGVCFTFFCYFAINMAMVMGLAPVVGVPLPLVSYGGTSMLVILFAFGLLLSAQVHGNVPFKKRTDA